MSEFLDKAKELVSETLGKTKEAITDVTDNVNPKPKAKRRAGKTGSSKPKASTKRAPKKA